MAQIIHEKSPVIAVVTDSTIYSNEQIEDLAQEHGLYVAVYLNALKEVEDLAQEYGLRVADMPMSIQAMTRNPGVRETARVWSLDTITSEYYGKRDGDQVYEVWHSAGSLATVEGFKFANNRRNLLRAACQLMPIDSDEWTDIGNGKYLEQEITRVHLDDMKKGDVPVTGTPYTSFVRLDKDNPNFNETSSLEYDTFMGDDRVLMLTGGPDNREALAKILFEEESKGGEGWRSIGNQNRIKAADFNSAKGRLTSLMYRDLGFGRNYIIGDSSGRFLAISNEVLSRTTSDVELENSDPQKLAHPTLEQTLSVIKNPDLNTEDMVRSVSELYNQ